MAAVRHEALPSVGPDVPGHILNAVRDQLRIPRLKQVHRAVSPRDGFTKYLFQSDDGALFEAVRIPLLHRPENSKYIVCVSSQVGCALRCAFCATGRLGFRRNLETWEIVDQVIRIQADSPSPVRGVVFMGMGEPLLNYEAVIRAARIMSDPCGLAIAGKAITISTAGVTPAIRRFTEERHLYRLLVSLTSADPDIRRQLMPVEAVYPLPELMHALRAYYAARRRRITLVWPMIFGVNTREEDARALGELVRGMKVKIDLIDIDDTSGFFSPPNDEARARFRDALRTHVAAPVTRRYSGGRDVGAACGQLTGTSPQNEVD
jgi:23S rRNA (adenine2503-C2)-methyltransferase